MDPLLDLLADQLAARLASRLPAAPERPIALAGGWGAVAGGTLLRWARTGRLEAYRGARGQLLAFPAELRRAVEAAPYAAPLQPGGADPFDDCEAAS